MRPLIWGSIFASLTLTAQAAKTVLTMNGDERMTAKISNKSMNRLTVVGDQIAELVGVSDQIAVEKDSSGSHAFVKVPEHITDPIDLTLITQGGVVQDLSLVPSDIGAATIMLQPKTPPATEQSDRPTVSSEMSRAAPRTSLGTVAYQEALVDLMKTLYLGSFDDGGFVEQRSSALPSVSIRFVKGCRRSGFQGERYEISTDGEDSIDLSERDFFKMGDLALALTSRSVSKTQKSVLFVVRRVSE